jgi:hypothetical protein
MHLGCVRSHRRRRGSSEPVPTARSSRSQSDRKSLRTVAPERVHGNTVGDLLAILLANGGSGCFSHTSGRASHPA